MENIRKDSILSFDTYFCNNNIRILKVFVPFMHTSLQKYLVILIKYLEIQYALECFKSPGLLKDMYYDTVSHDNNSSLLNIFDDILPYCSSSQKEQFLQIRNCIESFLSMREMMDMFGDMKDMFPEGMNDTESLFNIFSNMQQ